MYKRILLPLDGSDVAEQALPHAIAVATSFKAELNLIQVIPPVSINVGVYKSALDQAEMSICKMAQDYLDGIATRFHDSNIVVKTTTILGAPQVQIVRFAEKNSVDLIVICSRWHSDVNSWLMGSIVDNVCRGVNIPVLLIRAK